VNALLAPDPDAGVPPVTFQVYEAGDGEKPVTVAVQVTSTFGAAAEGDGVHELIVGTAGADTAIAVHAPQLSFSSDSVMIPRFDPLLLSAHTRRYLVVPPSPAGKVYEMLVGAVPPESITPSALTPTSDAPPPEASFAFWRSVAKPAPVEAAPLLVTVAEYEAEEPVVADVGETLPVVRLGCAVATVTAVQAPQLFASSLSVIAPTNEVLLSAQMRVYQVPAVPMVYV
jgi:hypothetical protein